MKNKSHLLIVFILILIVGSFREVIFVNLNNQISFLNGEIPKNGLLSYLSFIENYSFSTLLILKWFFTIAYTLFFLFVGRYVLGSIFNSHELNWWYTIAYFILFVLSGAFFLFGYFIGSTQNMFSLARTLMGALQSPIPLLIISPLLFLKKAE